MKINPTILAAIHADGLRIVDEDNVSAENEFENEAIHQEMADLNIDHASELAATRAEVKRMELEYDIYGRLYPYGMPSGWKPDYYFEHI